MTAAFLAVEANAHAGNLLGTVNPHGNLAVLNTALDEVGNQVPTAFLAGVIHVFKGEVYFRMGRLDEAMQQYQCAIGLGFVTGPLLSRVNEVEATRMQGDAGLVAGSTSYD